LDLIDPKATSDDEPEPLGQPNNASKAYHIKRRPERSADFDVWIRLLDKKREEDTCRDPTKRWRERV
jgi:hypothetical protein